MPALVAHRGYTAKFPENTLPALQAALQAGARWLECDVQLTADQVPVLLHDDSLERTAGDPRRVFDLDAHALAGVSVHEPDRFGDAFAGTPTPALEAAVELVAQHPGVTLFVEVKRAGVERFGIDTVLARVGEACAAARAQCVIIAFDDAVVRQARDSDGFRIGWIIRAFDAGAERNATAVAPDFLFVNFRKVPEHQALWPGPWQWACYSAEDADTALALATRGFELVETGDIAGLLADPRIARWES